MPLIIAFSVFILSMIACIALGYSVLIALLIGLVGFWAVGMKKGFSFDAIAKMAAFSVKESLIVIEIMLMIGFITALWRSAGTITFFVYYGVKIITPGIFILMAYLMCIVLSFILGTSFGVAGTLGVILMTLARAGGVDPILTAGAIISGVYFGDRCSPASSSAILVATATKSDLVENIKYMLKTAIIPTAICIIIYGFLSFRNPMLQLDASVIDGLVSGFSLSPLVVLPALFILILPLFKVDIRWAFLGSIVTGYILSVALQGLGLIEALRFAILGYIPANPAIRDILSGGGAVSMLGVTGIIILSCSYSGIFSGTDMLSDVQAMFGRMIGKIGRFPTMVIVGMLTSMVFCNQTIATLMSSDLLTRPYLDSGSTRTELAIDMENSLIVMVGLVPWALACSVPLSMLSVSYSAILFAFFLYLVPLTYFCTKKWFFPHNIPLEPGSQPQ